MNASEKKINNNDNRDMDNKTAIYEHQILDTSSIGILITRISDNEILYANKAVANLLGISDVGKMIGKQGSNFYWDANEYQVLQEQFRAKGVLTNYELRARHADDSMFWILISVRYFDFQGEQALISEIVDITERKQAEAAMHAGEERFRRFADATNEGLVFHEQGKIIDANPAALAMFGLSDPTEFIGQSLLQFLAPESHEVVLKQMQLENVLPYEVHCLHKDGTLFPVETSTRTYMADSRIIRATSIRDITTRKQAEKALHESEERFRRFTDATLEGLVFHEQGKIIDVNPAAAAMFGLPNIKDLIGRNLMEFVVPEFHQLIMQQMQLESVLPYEIQCIRNDGSFFPVETSTRAYKDGERIIRATSVRNITERKQADARLRTMVENAPEAIVIIDLNTGLFTEPNENAVKLYALSREELAKVGPADMSPPTQPDGRSSVEKAMEKINAAMQGETPVFEWVHRNARGEDIPCEIRLVRLPGDLPLIRSSVTDISERKRVDAELRQNELLLSNAIQIARMGYWDLDIDTQMFIFNDQYYRTFHATTTEEMGGNQMSVADFIQRFIPPGEGGVIGAGIQDAIETKDPNFQVTLEAQNLTAQGELRWVSVWLTVEKDAQGRTTKLHGVNQDITERKRAGQALQESQRLLQLVMDNIPQAVFWKDKELTYLGTNRAFAEDAGFNSPQDLVGKTDFDMPWKEQAELYRADDQGILELGEAKLNYEEPQTSPTGEITWLRTSKIPMRDVGGKIFAVLGMYEDITEQKRLQQQVQEAFERRGYQVQISTEISQEVAAATELSDLFTRVVTLTKERLGYYHTQLLRYDAAQDAVVLINGYGETGQKMLADGHRMPMGAGLIGTAAASGETVLRPALAEDPDWHPNPLLPDTQGEIAVPIKLGDQILGVLDVQSNQAGALTEDDRLLLEGLCGQIAIAMHSAELVLSVRESELRYQQILDAITDMILVKGAKSSIVWANKAFREYYGMTNEQLRDMIDAPLVEPDYTLQYIKDDAYVFESGEVLAIPEEPVTRYDGSIRPFETFKAPIRDLNGNVVMTVGVSRDITERLKDKQAMAERLDEVNRLYQSMSHEGWKTYRDTADLPAGFIYDQAGIRPVDDEVLAGEFFSDIPMKVLGGEVVGTLTVANDPQHPMSPEDYTFLQQVSDQIALALESARLFEQTQSALAQSGKLFEASQKLAQVVDLQELVKTSVEIFNIPVLNGAELDMFSYDADGELESITVTANWWNGTGTEPGAIGSRFTKGMFSAVKLFLTSTPVFISDALNSERVDEGMLRIIKAFNIRAATFLPLFVGTHQVGVLVMHAEEPHNFTEEETRLFSGLSPLIATVLENRRQFERAQRQADREAMLNAISQKIQSATSVEAVLQIAARELGHALGAPRTIAQLSMKETK